MPAGILVQGICVKNRIVIASKNSGKVREIHGILSSTSPRIEILDLTELSYAEKIDEIGNNFIENAIIKAKAVYVKFKLPVIADDSGLCVEALGGRPGVFSARFAGPYATDEENNRLLIEKMKNVREKDRKAWFSCVAVFYYAENRYFSCEGRVYGVIAEKPVGRGGFGYDPLFYLPSYGKTMAQLKSAEKNSISHRGKAFRALKKYIDEYFRTM